jgi:hypothetical protein
MTFNETLRVLAYKDLWKMAMAAIGIEAQLLATAS